MRIKEDSFFLPSFLVLFIIYRPQPTFLAVYTVSYPSNWSIDNDDDCD